MAGATRAGDPHLCPEAMPAPHLGGPVQPPASADVEASGLPLARAGDRATCGGSPAPDFIVTGSGTVLINDMPAARVGDKTMHGGAVIFGDANVEIYGPTVGITLGGVTVSRAICKAMKDGRNPLAGTKYPPSDPRAGQIIQPKTPGQSYSNCGIESARQIINHATNSSLSQEALLDEAERKGFSVPDSEPFERGKALPKDQAKLLQDHGVPAHVEPATLQNLQQAVAENRSVIASLMGGTLWNAMGIPGNTSGTIPHSVLVTGLEYDEHGQLKHVIINDTGTGECGQSVPAAVFTQALKDFNNRTVDIFGLVSFPYINEGLVVTDRPIW